MSKVQRLKSFLREHPILVAVCIALTIIPFTWMKPGEMDIGGDSSRLYFYNPVAFLQNMSFFSVSPVGEGPVEPSFFYLPFVGMLALLNALFRSPYILISIMNVIKLILAFLSIYWIILELRFSIKDIKRSLGLELAAILAGLFYIFTPSVIGNWAKAILSTNQIFLNPLMFLLMLRYLLTARFAYVWIFLGVSFIFSPNFGLTSAPPFFAFYPLSVGFLFLYVHFVRKRPLPLTGLVIGAVLFLGIQAFHLLPQVASLFDPGSFSNTRVFDRESIMSEGVNYFSAVLPYAKVSWFLLLPPYNKHFAWISFIVPTIVCVALVLNRTRKSKGLILIAMFFTVTLFLVAANITHLWVSIYKRLFLIPGFSMFRNFLGQWQFVYSFFYAILFGKSLTLIFSALQKKYVVALACLTGTLFVAGAWPFLNGMMVNPVHADTEADVRVVMRMDPKFEETLAYLQSLEGEGKILTVPFSDGFYQIVHGINNGAYVGSSINSQIGGRNDYGGYSTMPPFPEVFYRLSKERNIDALKKLFALLNIRYIFHNIDVQIYDQTFPRAPYSYVRNFLPKTQKEMVEFVSQFSGEKIYENGSYTMYRVNSSYYLPHVYTAKLLIPYDQDRDDWYGANASFFVENRAKEPRVSFIEGSVCTSVFTKNGCNGKSIMLGDPQPKIHVQRVNPVKFIVSVSGATKPYFLVFSEKFNKDWKLYQRVFTKQEDNRVVQEYFNGDILVGSYEKRFWNTDFLETLRLKTVADNRHIVVNGYANAWYISPSDTSNKSEYELILEMTGQRYFYAGLAISLVVLFGLAMYGVRIFRQHL